MKYKKVFKGLGVMFKECCLLIFFYKDKNLLYFKNFLFIKFFFCLFWDINIDFYGSFFSRVCKYFSMSCIFIRG